MKRTVYTTPPITPFQVWHLAWQTQEMLAAAALTIGLRTFALGEAAAGLRPHDRRENARMVAEKMRTVSESAVASAPLWPQLTVASPAAVWGLGLRMATAGLRPYHSRTTSNAKRLMGKRLRRP